MWALCPFGVFMEKEFDLSILVSVLKRCWIWMIVFALFFCIVGGLAAETMFEDVYSSSVSFFVVNKQSDIDYSQSSIISASRELAKEYIGIIQIDDRLYTLVSERLEEEYGYSLSSGTIHSMVTTSQLKSNAIFSVVVSSTDPDLSLAVAQVLEDSIPARLDEVTQKENAVSILSYGKYDWERDKPDVRMYALVSAAAAAAVCYLIFFIRMAFSSKIVSEDDVKAVFNGPVIGNIPYYNVGKDKQAKV